MFNRGIKFDQIHCISPRRVLAIAMVFSFLAHAAVFIASPRYAKEFTPAKLARYDAALTPVQKIIAPPTSRTGGKIPTRVGTPSPITKTTFTPASAARFFAPENAIAVATNAANATSDLLSPLIDALPQIQPESVAETPRITVPSDLPTNSDRATPTSGKQTAPAFAERISINYKLTSSIADGIAIFNWTRKGNAYEIESSTQASGFLIGAFTGVLHQKSVGTITENGLRPSKFSIRRGEGDAETAEFKLSTNALTLKWRNNVRIVPLNHGMQDMQSFLFQLAYDAPNIVAANGKLDVLVTNARKVYRYQFRKTGEEIIQTGMGPVETIRLLSESPNPEDAYEVWLATRYFYLPVKIKMHLGRFPFEQLATRIGVAGSEYSAAPNEANAADPVRTARPPE